METLAYTYSYASYEQTANIEYDFSELNLVVQLPYKNLAHLFWLGLLSTGLTLSVLTVTEPAFAQYIQRGMRGESVANVQTLLRNRGYSILFGPNGAGQGRFGPQTEQAVRAFQRSVGLRVDGVVGPNTLRALQGGIGGPTSSAPATTSSSGNYLRLGSKGQGVQQVQTLLRNQGYSIRYGANGERYGVFDQQTLRAVRQFQAKKGLAVDGIVGPRTLAALRGQTVASSSSSSTGTGIVTGNGYRVSTSGRGLNIRSGPGQNFDVVGSLANNAPVNVRSFPNSQWAEIGPGQFVAARYIQQR
ncbi:peptidoglycan-binding protein [Spirulina sp. CS-785/01]|uniref:peptidoglycan-binding protein n=1 Tax=Spirulina sp. CS-785/01 TaxID=3021716 RepID=UPI002330B3B3|nr:peptidoglycan-binding protein [Spirulina sp. CS-785/01]MDB9315055.1 peptidoglycan-binding protein [Spirulina sp. CS-785/01]